MVQRRRFSPILHACGLRLFPTTPRKLSIRAISLTARGICGSFPLRRAGAPNHFRKLLNLSSLRARWRYDLLQYLGKRTLSTGVFPPMVAGAACDFNECRQRRVWRRVPGRPLDCVHAHREQNLASLCRTSGRHGEVRRVMETPGTVPRWSPNGQWISFSPNRSFPAVFSSSIPMAPVSGNSRRPAAGPCGGPSESTSVSVVGPDGNQQIRVTIWSPEKRARSPICILWERISLSTFRVTGKNSSPRTSGTSPTRFGCSNGREKVNC